MSDGVWDLIIHGRPVVTLEDLTAWLRVPDLPEEGQRTAVRAWQSMNRRAVPPALQEEIDAWLK